MAYSTLRDYLKTKLKAIQSVGTVHDYYRFLKGKKNVEEALFEKDILNAWFIRKIGEKNVYTGPGSLEKAHAIHVVGVMAINDEIVSEKVFLNIIADILTALQADTNYGGLCFKPLPTTLAKHDIKGFAGILCHYAIIQELLIERVSL